MDPNNTTTASSQMRPPSNSAQPSFMEWLRSLYQRDVSADDGTPLTDIPADRQRDPIDAEYDSADPAVKATKAVNDVDTAQEQIWPRSADKPERQYVHAAAAADRAQMQQQANQKMLSPFQRPRTNLVERIGQ